MILLLSLPGGTEWILLVAFLGAWLIPLIFYINTLQTTLNILSEENRKMPPGQVWLLLIPLFAFVWHFFVIKNIANSINAEANSLNVQLNETMPAYSMGLAMCILNCLILFPNSTIKFMASVAAMVFWIIYWVKISNYKNILLKEKQTYIGEIQ